MHSGAGRVVSVSGKAFVRSEDVKKKQTKGETSLLRAGAIIQEGDVINTNSKGRVKLLMKDRSIVDLGSSTLFKVNEYKVADSTQGKKNRKVDLSLGYGKIRALVDKRKKKKGSFRVRTRSATMGVRGTEFIVKSDLRSFDTGALAAKEDQPSPTDILSPEASSSNRAPSGSPQGGQGLPSAPQRGTQVIVVSGRVAVDPSPSSQDSSQSESESSSADASESGQTVELTAGKAFTVAMDSPTEGDGASAAGSTDSAPQVTTLSADQMSSERSEAVVEDNTFDSLVTFDEEGKREEESESGSQEKSEANAEAHSKDEPSSNASEGEGEREVASTSSASSDSGDINGMMMDLVSEDVPMDIEVNATDSVPGYFSAEDLVQETETVDSDTTVSVSVSFQH